MMWRMVALASLIMFVLPSQAISSVLSQAAQALAPGEWGSITTTMPSTPMVFFCIDNKGTGCGNKVMAFQGKGSWDSVSSKIVFRPGSHQNGAGVYTYDEATNTWARDVNMPTTYRDKLGNEGVATNTPPNIGEWSHGYNWSTISESRRLLFTLMGGSANAFWKYNLDTQIWTQLADEVESQAPVASMHYIPRKDQVWYLDGVVGAMRYYNPDTNVWAEPFPSSRERYDGGGWQGTWNKDCMGRATDANSTYAHMFFLDNPARNVSVFGGGNSTLGSFGSADWSTHMCTWDEANVLRLMPPLPAGDFGLATTSDSTRGSQVLVDENTGLLYMLHNTGIAYQFDFASEAWAVMPENSTRPSELSGSSNVMSNTVATFIHEYGVIAIYKLNEQNPLTTMYLYKTANPPEANTLTIYETSGGGQTNRPVSVSRPFRKGEVVQCVEAVVGGSPVTTQTDVKARWNDGTLKHAIVSFVVPSLSASGSVSVQLRNQVSCNNTGQLTQAGMLAAGFNFQTQIALTNGTTKTVNARTMLSNGHWRYWLQGPIVTAVLIEDRTASRTYDQDFGTATKNLHPIIEAWFYPQNNSVQIGATIENIWASNTTANSMADTTYSLSISSGDSGPTTEYTHASFNHTGRTRWHRRFWNGASDPAGIRIDQNLDYLVTTGAIPHYDPTLTPAATANDGMVATYAAESGTLTGSDGNAVKLGNYDKAINQAGANDWIGFQKRWETHWLYTMADEDWNLVLGNADLAGRFPIYLREADTLAGSGDYFDQDYTYTTNLATSLPKNGTGTVGTLGRIVSLNARPTLTTQAFGSGNTSATDKINVGTITNDGWNSHDSSHLTDACYTAYLFTGRYYYLECLQMEAAYFLPYAVPSYDSEWARPGPVGLIHHTNVRGDAWAFMVYVYAAFMSPDGEPEQAYFIDKVKENIAEWEGVQNLTLTDAAYQQVWNYGRVKRTLDTVTLDGFSPSPLGQWYTGSPGLGDPQFVDPAVCPQADSPWQENFLIVALGLADQMEVADTTTLLKYLAKVRFRHILDANTHLGDTTPSFYLLEAYRTPRVKASPSEWVQTWTELLACVPPSSSGQDNPRRGWNTQFAIDHSYRLIARSALSFLTPYTVDGYSGATAWTAFESGIPNPTTDLQQQSLKWAMTPLVVGSGGSPPAPPEPILDHGVSFDPFSPFGGF